MPSTEAVPIVSVILPVYNGGSAFKACLQSLDLYLPASTDMPTEVIVVADGCTDGSDTLAEKFGAKVLRTESPSGPARARNIGARQARGSILFFIDADVTIHPDTISQVVTTFQDSPDLAAVIGSYDDEPGAPNFLSQYKNLFHHYTHQTSREDASTFWGACGAIRKQAFWAVGGFDERYLKPSIEDIELGYRLKHQGYSIRLCKTLLVKHLKRWELISLLRADLFYRALPWTELLLCRKQMTNDLNLKLSTRLSVVLTFGLLVTLLTGWWLSDSVIVIALVVLCLLSLNLPVYLFFHSKRGFRFTLKVIPWHWLYFFYSGLAYSIGTIQFHFFPKTINLR